MASEKELAHGSDSDTPPAEKHEFVDGAKDASDVPWTAKRIIAIASLCGVYVGAQAILYMTSGCLTYIAAAIGTMYPNWLLTANNLCVAAICPFVGYLTDLLGRRWLTVFGGVLLVVSSAMMGKVDSLAMGIGAQALGGIGAGICELTALAGVAEITPTRWRGVSLAVVTFSILPFIPYLIYIQQLVVHSTWRWVFLIVGIWNFLSFVGVLFCYNPPPRHQTDGLSKMDIIKRIDYVGALLSIGGVTLFLVGLQAVGYQYAASSGKVLGPLIVGIILILLFPLWEWKGTKYPMVPWDIFRGQSVVGLAYALVFVAGMNFYSVLGFFPVMLQTLYPYNPLTIGIRGLCYPLAILGGACVVNTLMSYTNGHVRQMFFFSALLMTLFCGLLSLSTPFNPGLAVAFATLGSWGIGSIIVPSLTLCLYACPDKYIGTTAALSLSVRFLGGAVGTSIYYNIFNNKIMTKLGAYVAEYAVKGGLPKSQAVAFTQAFVPAVTADPTGASALKIPGATLQIVQSAGLGLRWAYADSLAYVWYATVAFGVVSMVFAAFIPNIRKYMTNKVAVDLH